MTVQDGRRWNDLVKRDSTFWAAFNSIHGDPRPDRYEGVILSRVYFALDPDACQIKIGYTWNLKRRIKQLQQQRPNLELLGALAGGYDLERAMLGRFDAYLIEGREWFSSEIIQEVGELLGLTTAAESDSVRFVASRSVSAASAFKTLGKAA